MEYNGSSAYDENDFFSNYMRQRARTDSPNNAIESPIIYELIGDFKNKSILDLGCGDASFGRELLHKGASFYTGIDGSEQMVAAKQFDSAPDKWIIHHNTMEAYQYPTSEFDIVTSRFAIHYVSEITILFRNIHKALKTNGHFVFSVQHPLTTSSFKSKQKNGDRREDWIVDDYFLDGERKEPWIGKSVVKYHRTIEQYFSALTASGFSVIDLREGTPKRENFSSQEEFTRRLRIPVVLAFSCKKINEEE